LPPWITRLEVEQSLVQGTSPIPFLGFRDHFGDLTIPWLQKVNHFPKPGDPFNSALKVESISSMVEFWSFGGGNEQRRGNSFQKGKFEIMN
jgi:hypothetical protein